MKVTIQPTVHMLWEDDDPSLILTERFGLADASAAQRRVSGAGSPVSTPIPSTSGSGQVTP